MTTVIAYFVCVLLLFSPAAGLLFKVPESAPVGHVVGYIEGKPKIATQPTYFVVYSDQITEKYLRVDEGNGEIRIISPLDFEENRQFELLAIPVNGGGEGIQCTIEIEDENDHSPQFADETITIEISEFARIGAEFPLPLAKDEDGPKYKVQKYRIAQGNVNNVFKMQTRSLNDVLYGYLIVNGQLDREYRDKYELIIEAIDGGKPAKIGRLRVHIRILDANDNPPVFKKPRYSISIPASTSIGSSILTLTASDSDLAENSQISFRLQKTKSNSLSFFSLSSNGVLSTTAHLLPGAVYDLVVAASDKGNPPLETTAFVSVTVQGLSVDDPALDIIWLTSSSSAHLLENITLGSIVARVSLNEQQKDNELLMFGCPSICIQQSDSSHIYLLLVCGIFDRETTQEYHLKFRMQKKEKVILEHPVLLTIGDVNDNAPTWPQQSMHIALNRSGENYMSLTATDPDQGINGRIRYSIPDSNIVSIDPDTGRLIIANELNCSVGSTIQFKIRAKDSGKPSLYSDLMVVCDLIDPSGKPPQFTKSLYEVMIKEDLEKGNCIVKVQASNSACGASSTIRYSFHEKSSHRKLFSLDPITGTICIEKALDYETIQSCQLRIVATDQNGLSETTLVHIRILDVNDNLPIFHPIQYNISLKEGKPPNGPLLAVSATDADSASFGEISFSLLSKNSPFKVDSKTGELFAFRDLSRGEYQVLITASDGSGAKAENPAEVHVNVLSKEAVSPSFTQSKYVLRTTEDILPGISIGSVHAKGKGRIKYSIYSGDPHHQFAINEETGRITVVKYLDADQSDKVLLNIQADLEGGASNHSQVIIEIKDHNDNAPVFSENSVEVTIREDQPLHEAFYVVQANDKDRNKNGEISYTLLSSHPKGPFMIHPLNGQIQLTAPVDFEQRREYKIRVKATDHGVPPKSANMTIFLHISDVNDNRPIFEKKKYQIKVVENSPSMLELLKISATDKDSSKNGMINYRITNGTEIFGIDKKTGVLFLKGELDREERNAYNITITAEDSGNPPLSSSVTVGITVLDENDNAPSCTSMQTLVVPSDANTNTPFGSIVISDPDLGENGTVVYKTQQSHPIFQLLANGDVILRRLLRDSDASDFRLAIIASDEGSPKKSAVCQIPVKVIRGTTNITLIPPVLRTLRVPVDCKTKCNLTEVKAKGVHKWQIQSSAISSHFSISSRGVLSLLSFPSPLPPWSLTLILSDSEGRQKHLMLKILPSVSKYLRESLILSPTTAIGSKIAVIGRKSNNDDWFYKMSNKSDLFELDEQSGTVYLSGRLNEHSDKTIQIYFEKINTISHNTENIEIEIQVSENSLERPFFDQEFIEVDIFEDQATDSVITSVLATVTDPNTSINYRLISKSSHFSIDQYNGDVTLIEPLDTFEQKQHILIVEAYTQQSNSSCLLQINVIDTNNHRPEFLSSDEVSIFPESLSVIHTVVGHDKDEGVNGELIYSIISDPNQYFSIDNQTGEIRIEKIPSSDTIVIVRVTDKGKSPLFTDQTIKIRVTHLGNNWRFFEKPHFSFAVENSLKNGDTIGRIFGKGDGKLQLLPVLHFISFSNDELKVKSQLPIGLHKMTVVANSPSGEIDWATVSLRVVPPRKGPRISSASCASVTVDENRAIMDMKQVILSGEDIAKFQLKDESGLFQINSISGVISCSELDRETKAEHLLVVTAETNGKNDSCTIRVVVNDINDNSPQFSPEVPDFIELNANSKKNDPVLRLTAFDSDIGENGQIFYELVEDPSNIFDIDQENGIITIERNVAYTAKEWQLLVRATDRGDKPLTTEKYIQVRDRRESVQNEERQPSFLRHSYISNVAEGLNRGQQIVKLSTTSRDAHITYSIVEGNLDSAFEVDNEGVVRTAQELDFEIRPVYHLRVIGTGRFKGEISTNLHVKINNVNDNPPAFPKMRMRKFSEGLPVGSYITTVQANDVDKNSIVEYSIESNKDLFVIDRYTGVVHTKSMLDFEKQSEITLKIVANDGKHNATGNIQISLLDENDHAPEFPKTFYDIKIPSATQVDDVILKMLATDSDSAENGRISYSILGKQNIFSIDNNGNLRLLSPVFVGSEYLITVSANDHGHPIMTSSVPVRITVTNEEKKEKTEFPNNEYEFMASESILPHIVFGNVSVGGKPAWYRILDEESSKTFNIDRLGRISAKCDLDREKRESYSFTVDVGSDSAVLHANSTTNVIVRIGDVNDNSPVFTDNLHSLIIDDSLGKGDTVTRFTASDPDFGENGRISFNILSGNDYRIFSLNPETGALIFNEWHDDVIIRHPNGSWNMIIEAKDSGIPSRSSLCSVEISVSPSWSGTAPFFVQSRYVTHVDESTERGTVVFVARAVNRAGVQMDKLTYSFKKREQAFSIDSRSGVVRLVGELDYETRTSYRLEIIAADDKLRSAVVMLEIRVTPIDEYPPVFTKGKYTFQVPYDSSVGTKIGEVRAVDPDGGVHGIVHYYIEETYHLVTIDETTGQIYLAQSVRNHKNLTIEQFSILASSGKTQKTHATVYLEIGPFEHNSSPFSSTTFKIAATATVTLFCILLILLVCCVCCRRSKVKLVDNPQKQVYSVSRGHTAILSDPSRVSPVHKALPSNVKPKSSSMNSSVSTSSGLRSALSQRDFVSTRSQPDSGIDPDTVSINSSVTDYLVSIGVNPHPIPPKPKSRRDTVDSDLNELIYARVDDIIGPGPIDMSKRLDTFEQNPISMISSISPKPPPFQPLTEIFREVTQMQEEERKNPRRDYVQIEI